jgi:hypothetical protein
MSTRFTSSCVVCIALLFSAACNEQSTPQNPLAQTGAGDGGGGAGGESRGSAGGSDGSGAQGATGGQGGEAGVGGAGGVPGPCGADHDNGDGSCTRFIEATVGETASGYMQRTEETCPLDETASGPYATATMWTVEAYLTGGVDPQRRSSFLTFDTSSLGGVTSIEGAQLFVYHANVVGFRDSVWLIGGVQPLFGPSLDVSDFGAGVLPPLDVETMDAIEAQGRAEFAVPAGQINDEGNSQLILHLARLCEDFAVPAPGENNNYWQHYAPGNADASKRPTLAVVYQP